MIARMASGVSALALTQAHADWPRHLLLSPDEQIELLHKAARKWARFFPCSIDQPLPQDKRFAVHSEYLRRLYLNNDLAEGRFEVDGKPVSLRDIHVPLFAVSTIADHVAPWRSVSKIPRRT
jgi:poly(hydroxyalkanoate) polymerase-like protein